MQNALNNMATLSALIKKESLHIIRDPRTLIITLLMPLILLLLFGFAISTEITDIRLCAVVERHSDETRNILERINANEYFDFRGLVSPMDVDELLTAGKCDAVLILRDKGASVETQIIVDASNPSSAQSMTAYIEGVVYNRGAKTPIITSTLYNPLLKSAYNFVPGILGMIFILICAIMTSVSIVREKETGTLNLLIVSPIKSSTIILGKLVPYFILSCIILAVMLLLSYCVLGMPFTFRGMINVIVISLIYIILALSIGLLISSIVNTQLAALIVSAMAFMIPVIFLSGMIFPIDNLPEILQWVSCIVPARWYIASMRKLMVQQLDLSYLTLEIGILIVMTAFMLVLAIKKFKSKNK